MTYPSENFYPGFEAPRSSRGRIGLTRFTAVVVEAVSTAMAHYDTFRRERATIRQLSMLDDATLRDIGLNRGQIEAAARSAALAQRDSSRR